MRSQDTAAVVARSREALPEIVARDVHAEEPVPDEIIAAYQRIFTYDPGPLNAEVEGPVVARNWTRERISFDAAYGNERMVLYLYLPATGAPPYKTVIYWPGSNALGHNSIDDYPELHIDFVIKSGRAVAFPVIDGTFERSDRGPRPDIATTANRDLIVRRINDVRRSIDYLETRADIDSDSLGYFGWSWGGWNAPTLLTVDPRLRSAVLYVAYIIPLTGSFWSSSQPGGRMLPEVDPVTYLRKVDIPVLMLNGQFDNLGPLETSVRPFFALLGTAEPDKRHVVTEGGHFVPRAVLIRETLDWLDKYQGRPGS
jgi:pimeloyl-ACP methyl ester carboxylesterase